MASLLQKPTSEIIGHKCWELMHGSTKPIPECPIVRMKKSLKRETLTLPIGDKWFEVTTNPIIDKGGKLIGAVQIIVDITERKKAREEIERLASFPQLNPNPVIEVGSSGKISFYNDAAIETLRSLGIKEDVSVFLPDDISKILKDLDQKGDAYIQP